MTNCSTKSASFSPLKSKKVEGNFCGGEITSDGGALLLRETDKRLGLTKAVANVSVAFSHVDNGR